MYITFVPDSPDVTVGGTCIGGVSENNQCQLTCEARGGNPADVIGYKWLFRRKFTDTYDELSSSATVSSYSIDAASYEDAGVYACHVSHIAGDVSSDATVEVSCKWDVAALSAKIVWCRAFLSLAMSVPESLVPVQQL